MKETKDIQIVKRKETNVNPECGKKLTLLKLGAEKICDSFGLAAKQYHIKEIPLENEHMEYEIICTLKEISSGMRIGEGLGSCSTLEAKCRYRWDNKVERDNACLEIAKKRAYVDATVHTMGEAFLF